MFYTLMGYLHAAVERRLRTHPHARGGRERDRGRSSTSA